MKNKTEDKRKKNIKKEDKNKKSKVKNQKEVNHKETKQKENSKKEKKQNKDKKKSKTGIFSKIIIFLLIILIAGASVIFYKTQQNGGGMVGLLSALVGHNEETLKNLNPIQVLLMGVSTDNGGKLTDTIIIATYNPKKQTASLLSIPRDTFIGKNPVSGTGSDKINVLYQKSPEKTLQKVNELTGLDVKYYMVIDNQALIKLVDVIGGVDFEVPIDMDYDDSSQDLYIHLKKGMQKIDGNKAEQLLRFRKNNNNTTYPKEYGGDDYGRMRTQREFMIETVKQTITAKNILKVKDIIDIAYEYIETNLSISVIKDYVPYAINLNVEDIQSVVLPGGSYGPTTTPSYPLWFFIADKNKTAQLIEELYGDNAGDGEDYEEESNNSIGQDNESSSVEINKTEAGDIRVEILNGSGSTSETAELKKALEKIGYKVTNTSNTSAVSKTVIINKTDVDTKFTDNIKDIIGVGNISTSTVSTSNVDITIIIGKDYNK